MSDTEDHMQEDSYVIKEGWAMKVGGQKKIGHWQKRWLRLTKDNFSYHKKSNGEPRGVLALESIDSVYDGDIITQREPSWCVNVGYRTFYFHQSMYPLSTPSHPLEGGTVTERDNWIISVNLAVQAKKAAASKQPTEDEITPHGSVTASLKPLEKPQEDEPPLEPNLLSPITSPRPDEGIVLDPSETSPEEAIFDPQVLFERGEEFYAAEQYDLAVEAWKRAAELGNVSAMFNLGICARNGLGHFDRSYEDAASWYAKAAEGGHVKAMATLADAYANGIGVPLDIEKSKLYYQKAADEGLAIAKINLGGIYQKEGAYEEALALYESATDAHYQACHNLAAMYYRGLGVERDYPKAAALYLRAAESGYPRAQSTYAWMLAHGKGVEVDLDMAAHWYKKAAEQGLTSAQTALEKLVMNLPPE